MSKKLKIDFEVEKDIPIPKLQSQVGKCDLRLAIEAMKKGESIRFETIGLNTANRCKIDIQKETVGKEDKYFTVRALLEPRSTKKNRIIKFYRIWRTN